MCDLRSGGGEASPGHRGGSPGRGIGPLSGCSVGAGGPGGGTRPGKRVLFPATTAQPFLGAPDRVIKGAGQQAQNSQECLGDKCRLGDLAQKGKTGLGDAQGGAGPCREPESSRAGAREGRGWGKEEEEAFPWGCERGRRLAFVAGLWGAGGGRYRRRQREG